MARRRYDMGRRAQARERTRRRILEATMEVHDEQGIVDGRWPDIAERAGVSLATVYRHFPTLEELASACGELTMEVVEPPRPEDASAAFRGARSRAARVERLVRVVFGFYERAGRMVDNVRRDRHRLAALQPAHERLEAGVEALVDEALRPLGTGPERARVVRAMVDVRVWEALRDGGLDAEAAVDAAVAALLGTLRAGAPSQD